MATDDIDTDPQHLISNVASANLSIDLRERITDAILKEIASEECSPMMDSPHSPQAMSPGTNQDLGVATQNFLGSSSVTNHDRGNDKKNRLDDSEIPDSLPSSSDYDPIEFGDLDWDEQQK